MTVVTGIGRGAPGLDEASHQLGRALTMEGVEVRDQIKALGNAERMVCGYGGTCPMSARTWVFGDDTEVTPEKFCRVEQQEKTWRQARKLGKEINERLGEVMLL